MPRARVSGAESRRWGGRSPKALRNGSADRDPRRLALSTPNVRPLPRSPRTPPDSLATHRSGLNHHRPTCGISGASAPSLIELLEMALDEASWESFSRGSAVRRGERAGFAQNVCVGLGRWGLETGVPVLRSGLRDGDSSVRSHAAWALGRIPSPEVPGHCPPRCRGHSPHSWKSNLPRPRAGSWGSHRSDGPDERSEGGSPDHLPGHERGISIPHWLAGVR